MSQLGSPLRRVLGDKTTNASLRSQISTQTWKNPATSRDTLSVSFGDSARSPKRSPQFKSPRLGQKRRIEEVEGHEQYESRLSTDTQRLSQVTDVLSDGSLQIDDMNEDSTTHTKSTAQTSLTSFQAPQTEQEPAEFQFEIHEEMSQRTLDKMHEIALPQNTSQPVVWLRPSLLKEPSNVSVSMSSLIDFDEDKSSQRSGGLQMLDQPDKDEDGADSTKAKSEEETRKDMLAEKAETLRTRLQLAFYKLSTKQTSKPFSRLSQHRSRSPDLPQPLSSSPTSSPPNRHVHFSPMSPESRIAIARARAAMQAKPRVQSLDKLGHPTIVPTAFSARHTHGEATESKEPQIPSSPPLSNGIEASIPITMRPGTPLPPAKKRRKPPGARELPRTPMQLSSPPGSPLLVNSAVKKLSEGKGKYGGLTSSVVKGEAANGLLELMRGGSGDSEGVSDGVAA